MPRSVAVGLLTVAAWLAFTGPGPAQDPDPGPNERGWHTSPFTVTFSHPPLTCDPSQASYTGPDDANPAPLTSTCTDPNGQLPPETLTYEFKYDATAPEVTISRGPSGVSNDRTPSFSFTLSEESTVQCQLDAGGYSPCTSPWQPAAPLGDGPHTFSVSATDPAGNMGNATTRSWEVDTRPPPAPGSVELRSGDERISLSWTVARVADFRGTRVVRVRLRRPGALVRLTTRTRLTDTGLRNGARYRYTLRTIDRAGNRSRARVVYGRPRDPLLAPRDGAIVSRPPLLRWLARAHATYYNLQLYRVRPGRDLKMLSTWPIEPRYQLRQRWFFRGGRRVLRPGMYRWFVWPGFGSITENRYGRLIGTSVFTRR